jgi:hypothetical protein
VSRADGWPVSATNAMPGAVVMDEMMCPIYKIETTERTFLLKNNFMITK